MRHNSLLTWIFCYVLLFGIVGLLASCSKPKAIEYRRIENVIIPEMSLLGTSVLSMDIVGYNPNGFNVALKNVHCKIFANNQLVGSVNLDTLLYLPKVGEFKIPIQMRVAMSGLYAVFKHILNRDTIMLRMEGDASLGKFGWFTKFPIAYEVKQRIDL